MDRARKEGPEQAEAFEVFLAQQADRVPVWKELVLACEMDDTKKNPYDISVKGTCQSRPCGGCY